METQHCLSVVVGCPLFLRQLPAGPCLILDSDSCTFEHLLQEFCPSEHPWTLLFQQVVLSDSSGKNILWRKYNDCRFDGPWEQSILEHDYPNLRQIDTVSVQVQTLSDVLDSQACLQDINSEFKLIIRQGDTLKALKGATKWLHRCKSITLRGIDIPIGNRSECALFLSSNNFSSVEDDDFSVWKPKVKKINAIYLKKLKNSVTNFLDQICYQNLYPSLDGLAPDDVLTHWMANPDVTDDAVELFNTLRTSSRKFDEIPDDDPCLKALEALFPYQHYRSLRPDLEHLNDRKLLGHFCTDGLKEGIRLDVREFDEIPDDDPCLKALEALFPYHFYRSLRPDLDHLDDRKLLGHFCTDGLKEGIRLESGVEMQYATRALRRVFPYSYYRRLCPDLIDLDDESLLLYFCRNGLDQQIDLSEKSVQNYASSFPVSEVEALKGRIKELEQYLDLSRQQVNQLRNALSVVDQTNGK